MKQKFLFLRMSRHELNQHLFLLRGMSRERLESFTGIIAVVKDDTTMANIDDTDLYYFSEVTAEETTSETQQTWWNLIHYYDNQIAIGSLPRIEPLLPDDLVERIKTTRSNRFYYEFDTQMPEVLATVDLDLHFLPSAAQPRVKKPKEEQPEVNPLAAYTVEQLCAELRTRLSAKITIEF
ncbi:hypothetical protein pEaSNUABM14_00258 [Erwinia phage pEa_SNUABM_14]|uniref:Uncharacterized protein n=1 Tax=Erwinia phage pEa_SNUABM_7 TaxID=2866695 RepID=A0AAE7WSI2_9CAUD|nr:hypothetical protein MPK74_gp259 [Erwinia phage pEa_SNUABM_7]QYW03217.1 hypothetical protein pEaSNUABM13_00258 [Erwinia phage pEa_SNUABM_13]QYW03559.1 hypothetical protein pEaSNUABM34_00257 [Erwinia phage pEa_SNUABM_34]QYW03900.1 hypothetical protein pEaSNUABM45_00257 [Erwinia phage pEa_SNUABM_45]QYW04241.1 hypothetical protein pEaSNUABM46_00257 [Erwinia phage pEa_SNUABM_46]QYW04583.1 hypothetical protein pEaSNUABM14_00258 [Erwinia phage pEa_SNUABM_14]QYW05270.1 hypothetical protein pEaSNU